MAKKKSGTNATHYKNSYNSANYSKLSVCMRKDEAAAYKAACNKIGIPYAEPFREAAEAIINGTPKRTPKSERKQAEESRSNAERAQIQEALAAELAGIAEHLNEIGSKSVDGVQMLFYADVHDYIAERAQAAEARAEEYKQRAKGIIPNNPEE